jgi:hypothetical protein
VRLADAPAVEDQGVGRSRPINRRQRFAKQAFDLHHIFRAHQPDASRYAQDMPIDWKTWHA